MSEIRNLTRNGETFYPLTHIDAVLDKNGRSIVFPVDTQDTNYADLEFSDENDNVVLKCSGGHIKTKEFNSMEASKGTSVSNSDIGDFEISDESNNVILRISEGHIRTKEFNSKDIVNIETGIYPYSGERIDLGGHKFNIELLLNETTTSTNTNQGAACFDKYLFQFHHTNDVIDVFDLDEKIKIQEIQLEAISTYHCNNANFGVEYYNSGDRFPLLYVSMENDSEHKCIVYRVSGTIGNLTCTVSQIITLPVPSNDFLWFPNTLIDREHKKLIVYGLGNNPYSTGVDNIVRYKIFPLPLLSSGNITLSSNSVEDSMEFSNLPTTQGGFVVNAKIYGVFGVNNNGELNVIDINKHCLTSKIKLSDCSLNDEPEGCFLYDNTLCISFYSGSVYKFKF